MPEWPKGTVCPEGTPSELNLEDKIYTKYLERCLSGRKEQFAKLSYWQRYRGFESLSLRQFQYQNELKACKSNDCRLLYFSRNPILFTFSHQKGE